ncbi:MAG: PASTA domain-containing protein [Porphyromonas sp.]|nr:PASTA domain-containing protein [Porphyromonas sp.]
MSKRATEGDETKDTGKKGMSGVKYLLINIGLMVLVGLLLLWGSMLFLKGYTRHGQSIRLPDISGLNPQAAQQLLKKEHLNIEIVDSVYVEGVTPGIILDTTPKEGSLIKQGRTIFVTVNTMSVKQITIPNFAEQSERSVEMTLKGAGFKNVTAEYVPGQHHLLVLRLKDSTGRYLDAGDRVPYNTQLIMEVSSADMYEAQMLDSLTMTGIEESLTPTPIEPDLSEDNNGENWF